MSKNNVCKVSSFFNSHKNKRKTKQALKDATGKLVNMHLVYNKIKSSEYHKCSEQW